MTDGGVTRETGKLSEQAQASQEWKGEIRIIIMGRTDEAHEVPYCYYYYMRRKSLLYSIVV